MKRGGASAGAVILRCDAGGAIGFGHVKRCLAIAQHLAQEHGLAPVFAGRFDHAAQGLVTSSGFYLMPWHGTEPEGAWLLKAARKQNADAILFDIRTDLNARVLSELADRGCAVVTLDDASERRLVADLAILPPTHGALALEWPHFRGEALIGWAWTVLSMSIHARKPNAGAGRPLSLMVTMGGADPVGLTLRCGRLLQAIAELVEPVFVIGPAFSDPAGQVEALAALWGRDAIADGIGDLGVLAARSDLALIAYGVTAQELAAAGVPALYVGLTDDHVQSAQALAASGAGDNLGRYDMLTDTQICEAIAALASDRNRRQAMMIAGPKTIDGGGARRIAARIAQLAQRRKCVA